MHKRNFKRENFFRWQKCFFVLDRLHYNFNKELLDIEFNISTAKREGSLINAVGTTLFDIEKLVVYLKFKIQENNRDEVYKKVFFNTVVDVNKLMSGIYSNYIAKSLLEGLQKSVDFELKFPFKKVSKLCLDFV